MRLICPHCMSGVTVPDDAAGTDATCPNCGKAFPTPARYSAQVSLDPPVPPPAAPPPVPPPAPEVAPAPHVAPPPGLVPPAPVEPSGFLPPATPQAATPTAEGYTKSIGFSISPKLIAWLPAILLTCVLIFTFFPWVGCYTGGSPVYSQRPWGAIFGGSPNRNYKLEEAKTIPSGWLDKMRSDWKVLLPFFMALFVAIAFAWAERGLHSLDPRKIPPLAKLWPWRNAVIAACAGLALFFLVVQLLNGFGMERAIRQHITEEFAERREKAAGSPSALAKLEYDEEQAYNQYNVEHTSWFYLALVCNLLAVLALVTRAALDARGNKPTPKLLLHY